jgi:hypothetical protein
MYYILSLPSILFVLQFLRSRNSFRMADILRLFETMAAITTAIAPTKNMAIAMSTIQVSPIDAATRQHNWLFAGYLLILLAAAVLTWLVWRSGNRVQDLGRKEADARISESNAEAKRAGESAAQANERAGIANEAAGRANERAEKLEGENLTLRGQVATLETVAVDAKKELAEQQGRTAILERAAVEAKAAQQRVETKLAEQQERAAKAELQLAELRRRLEPRSFDWGPFLKSLEGQPKATVEVLYRQGDDAEGLAESLNMVLQIARWDVVSGPREITPEMRRDLLQSVNLLTPGVTLVLKNLKGVGPLEHSGSAADVLFTALFNGLGRHVNMVRDDSLPDNFVRLIVGPHP